MVAESSDRPDDLPGKVVAALDRLARGQRSRRQAVTSRHGITPLQADLLVTLSAGDPPKPVVGLLARELGVSQPTVTDSLRALEEKQLISRHRHLSDARLVSATLTPAGALLVAEIAAGDRELIDAVSALDRSRQEALLESTLSIISGLVASGFISVARTCLTCHYHQLDGASHQCTLLNIALGPADLRVNCPDYEAVATAPRARE